MTMCSVLFTDIAQVECVMISVVMAADVLDIDMLGLSGIQVLYSVGRLEDLYQDPL